MSTGLRKSGVSRRTLLKAGAAISMFPAPHVFAQSPESLKIGFLTVLTGPLAAGGKQQEEGAAFFLKERNGMIAGRKVELITQDTAGQPALAKTKTQELVERSQGAGDDRPARHQRSAGHGRLRAREQGAAHHYDIGRDRRSQGAPAASLRAARLRHRAAGDLSARRLRRQDARLQEHLPSSPRISPTATRAPADFSSPSRRPAARSCRSCGRRSTRPNTRLISRRSNRTWTRSTSASPAAIRCAFSSSSPTTA